MPQDGYSFLKRKLTHLQSSHMGKLFLDKKFFHYTWIGIFISVLNVFLLWLLIDILSISTVVSSILVIGLTFIIRYVLFRRFEAL
ncbi:MAG: GtrA family protein [Candidatus Vogelbacteria bacterium]|nr:GtrA family protein [Candidatus Vogelbacteria bacterium]